MRERTGEPPWRPWPLPTRGWRMRQTWRDLLFAHWPVPPRAVRARVPAGLALDTRDGSAWLSVVSFRMTGIRLRGLPPIPGARSCLELNLRTYVTVEDKPGVFFLSLDADSALIVAAARRWFHLPYHRARMALRPAGERFVYASRRAHPGAPPAEFMAAYRPVGEPFVARPASLEHWLTERYCLYAVEPRGQVHRGDIHHAPWRLQAAEAELARNTMAAAHGVDLPTTPPLLHFARRQDVRVWAPRRVGAA